MVKSMKSTSQISFRLIQPSICPRCQLRASRQKNRLLSTSSPKRAPSSNSLAQKQLRLEGRSIIRLAGPDAANFLHNIIPAKILGVPPNPVYTAFLSAQGRILNDVFVYPPTSNENKEQWFIEVDNASAGDLMKHLKKHKLRAKFALERLDPQAFGVYYKWPQSDAKTTSTIDVSGNVQVGGQDPRPGMGTRWIIDEANKRSSTQLGDLNQDSTSATQDDYTIHRMLNGIAEGQSEIISSSALPQESNLDFFGGIDFQKGCYLGQELTIRTHHTGVVRKRILPCQIYDESNPIPGNQSEPIYSADTTFPQPPPESNISKISTKKGRSTGKWLGGVGNIGLALCRLEMMTDIQLTADRTNFDPAEEYRIQWESGDKSASTGEVKIKPFVLPWLREGVELSLTRKERRPSKREEEEEYIE